MELHTLSLQAASAHGAQTKATSQELQPDRGEQGGGLEGAAGAICIPRLAALLFHTRDQHHYLVQSLQAQLYIRHIQQRLGEYANGFRRRGHIVRQSLTSALLCCCSIARIVACGLVDILSSGSLKAGAKPTSPLIKLTMLSMRAWMPSERLRSRSDSS